MQKNKIEKIVLETVDSTNEYIKRNLKEKNENCLVIAKEQTAGRGTHGRKWLSEKNKNITMSFFIGNLISHSQLADITIKIGEIIYNILSNNFNLNFEIKLPNDILCNKKKICGILCESGIENSIIKYLIIGIGLNVNQENFDDEVKDIATSLKQELGYEVEIESLIDEISEKIIDLF